MIRLILTAEQAELISAANDEVQIEDPSGKLMGYLQPTFSDAEIEQAKQARASNQRRYTTQEVLDRLRALDVQ